MVSTITTKDAMALTGKSRSAVNRMARKQNLGRWVGQMRVFTKADVATMRRTRPGNPNWVKGEPQPPRAERVNHGKVKRQGQAEEVIQ